MTIEQLKAKREEIRDDLLRASGALATSLWYRDRINEVASITRQIDRLEARLVVAK